MKNALVYLLALLAMVPIYFIIKKARRGGEVSYNELEAVFFSGIALVLVVVAFMME